MLSIFAYSMFDLGRAGTCRTESVTEAIYCVNRAVIAHTCRTYDSRGVRSPDATTLVSRPSQGRDLPSKLETDCRPLMTTNDYSHAQALV